MAHPTPEQEARRADFRIAIAQDCMGWFCAKYGWGKLEYEASSPIDLIRLVAEKIVQEEKNEHASVNLVGATAASAACPASSTSAEG